MPLCGIAGAVAIDGSIEPGTVQRMCETLAHRGPDSRGFFEDQQVALGAARLAVIDIEGGDQPIFNEDRSLVVVCNGEIYNYRELRRELVRRGHRFGTGSDTEVIVHGFEEWGERCLERLRGMFAFALWDGGARRLLLARDRVGKKPLFYATGAGRLWFASEPRAILVNELVPRTIDEQALDLYLHYQMVPAPRSAFKAIRKVRPAHLLSWHDGHARTRRYWKLSYHNRYPAISVTEACELIRTTLLEATRLRLRSDVSVGALLSGGVDSSAVVAAMARLSADAVKTFSVGFDVPAFDESASSRELARHYGTDHHELRLDATTLELLPRLAWHYGEPFADSSALATFALAEHASRHVTVVLNGDGGDESFAGYARHVPPLPRAPLIRHYAERRAHSYFSEAARRDLLDPEFLHSLGQHDWRSVVEEPYHGSDAETPLERTIDVDVQTYLADDLLVKMDIATMAHSLEARSPLCDQQVMELAAALPMEMKIEGSTTKALFKRAMRDWLPRSIVERPKMGFMIPIAEWLRGSGLATEILLDPGTLARGLFREERLRALVAEHQQGQGDHDYRVWTLLMLELWFRAYIDQPGPRDPGSLSVVSS